MKKNQNLIFLFLVCAQIGINGQIVVSTIAGSDRGFMNGSVKEALFAFPTFIVFDQEDNMYISDSGNRMIRKISKDGIVSTLAGTVEGYEDGSIEIAKFASPKELVVDKEGNIFVADWLNHCIRKITKAGIVSTFAGTNTEGYQDGIGTNARFAYPWGLGIDSKGNLIVVDNNNYKIRKITPEGNVSTIAGSTYGYNDGQGLNAQFANPTGLAIDKYDNIYVADTGNSKVRKIDKDGIVTSPINDLFETNLDLAIDDEGNLYVSDYNIIRKMSASGTFSVLAGNGIDGFKDGLPLTAQFDFAIGICVNKNDVFIADANNNRIRRIGEKNQTSTVEKIPEASLYPNPTSNAVFIKSYEILGAGKIELYNAHGLKIRCIECENLNSCEVNLSAESSGFYFIKAFSNKDAKVLLDVKVVKI